MSLFKKNKKLEANNNLQAMQQELSQHIYRLGALNYQKSIVKYQLSQIENEIVDMIKKADKLDADCNKVRLQIQEEMKAKVAEGQTNDKATEGA